MKQGELEGFLSWYFVPSFTQITTVGGGVIRSIVTIQYTLSSLFWSFDILTSSSSLVIYFYRKSLLTSIS
jgi:uncharacterized membrane protein YeiH